MTENGFGYQLDDLPLTSVENLVYRIKRGQGQLYYDKDNTHTIVIQGYQTSTGSDAELEMTDSIAISQLGKTELTLLLYGDADNASTNGNAYIFTYKSNDGEIHTVAGTGTATLNATKVAFVPAVTDYYCSVSFTGPADTNVNVYAATAGGAIYATIATTTTAATEAQLLGVGAIYGRSHTDHTDADGAVIKADYRTPWGECKKGALCTLDTNAGSGTDTEIRFFEADTTTTVKDFHRWVHLETDTTPTVNCHEFLVTDAACAAVDGSGGDVYGVITEGAVVSYNVRYYAPEGYDCWFVKADLGASIAALGDNYVLKTHMTLKDETYEKVLPHHFGGNEGGCCIWQLDEESDLWFEIVDLAGVSIIDIKIVCIEVKRL